jgi:hypothetical protein
LKGQHFVLKHPFWRLIGSIASLVSSFDNAFLSRFSLILKYPDLDAPSRRVLWNRVCRACRVEAVDTTSADGERYTIWQFLVLANSDPVDFDLDALSAIELNGRAIKQTVRTAQALALTRGVALNTNHIDTVLSMNVG